MMTEPADWTQGIAAVNDTPNDAEIAVTVRDLDSGETIFERRAAARADSVTEIGRIRYLRNRRRFFVIEWTGEAEGRNHYLAGQPPFDLETYRGWLGKSGLFGIK